MIHKIKMGHNLLWFGSTVLYVVGFVILNICHIYFLCYIIKTLNAYQYLYTSFCLKYISLIFSSGILQIRCHLESLMLQIEDLLIINKTHFFLTSWKSNYQSIFWNSLKFSKFLILSSSTKNVTQFKWSLGNATLTIITLFKILASNYLYSYQVHQSIHVMEYTYKPRCHKL